MLTHLDWSSLTAAGLYLMPTGLFCCPVSTANCQLPLCVSRRELLTRVPLPTSGRIEISSLNPLSGFAPKQTKGSSAWRTTYIVSHTIPSCHLFTINYKTYKIYIYIYIYNIYMYIYTIQTYIQYRHNFHDSNGALPASFTKTHTIEVTPQNFNKTAI